VGSPENDILPLWYALYYSHWTVFCTPPIKGTELQGSAPFLAGIKSPVPGGLKAGVHIMTAAYISENIQHANIIDGGGDGHGDGVRNGMVMMIIHPYIYH
jgi:hypothetical protein